MYVRSTAHQALGAAIRRARAERGLSQEQLALDAGLDRTYVGGIERGERNPSYATCSRSDLLKIAGSLGMPLSTLSASASTRPSPDRGRCVRSRR